MDTSQLVMALGSAIGMLLVAVMAVIPTAMEAGADGTPSAGRTGRHTRWFRHSVAGTPGSAHFAS